jgi:drug/metabolite transporter (DMT)-like permease
VQRRAALGVAGIAIAWGFVGLFVRWVPLPAVAIVFSRCAIAAVTLGAFLGLRHLRRTGRGGRAAPVRTTTAKAARRTPWWGLALLGAGLAVHWLFLVAAQQRAPLGTVLLITYLAPVLVTCFAPRLLGERVPRRTYVAVAIGLAGIAVLVRPGAGLGAGELLALGAAVTYAGYTLCSKLVVGDVGGERLAFAQLGVAAAVLLPFAATTSWGTPTADWWWLVVLGAVFTAGLLSLFLVLLNQLPAATVSVLSYLEPVSAVVVGWVFLGEVPTVTTVVGGAMVVLAGIMVLPRVTAPMVTKDGTVPSATPR